MTRRQYKHLEIDQYKDGGTLVIHWGDKVYHVDHRCSGDTSGAWTYEYPGDTNVTPVPSKEVEQVRAAILEMYDQARVGILKALPETHDRLQRPQPAGTTSVWLSPTKFADLPKPEYGMVAPALDDDGSFLCELFVVFASCISYQGGVVVHSDPVWGRYPILT